MHVLAAGGSTSFRDDDDDSFGGMTVDNSDCPYESYGWDSIYVLGVFATLVIVFGICANLLNTRIFLHRMMRASLINWYLAVLSISDLLMQVASFFMFCLPRLGELFGDFRVINFSYVIASSAYAVGMMAQTTSVWLTVAMSLHRFVGVCLPFKAGRLCSARNTRLVLIIVVLFGVVFNFSRFFEVVVVGSCFAENVNFTIVLLNRTELREDPVYKTILLGWCYTLVMFILPFSLLIFLNTNVIRAIRSTRRLHDEIGQDARQGARRRELAKEISTSVMLVGVVVVFLLCNTLALILNILEVTEAYRFFGHLFDVLVYISNVLVVLNSCVNIFIYCTFSEKFRLLLRHYTTSIWSNRGELLYERTSIA
ncbi:unnamed protein product [Soboliphyme baturini]|uniref:G_PROTEIN_RECEP_F1_2 domain-containing protein n=1 Tax=Soboliphyme baturini TaxID=241478 RepID=A0A183IXM0_9BILA|nr:unnamed protein product [Soboliphyme baturini]